MFSKQLFTVSKRTFSAQLASANPRVYLTVSRGGSQVGDLVFELYHDRSPAVAESFMALCTNDAGHSLKGTQFHHGQEGHGIRGGRIGEENVSAFGMRLSHEDHETRHDRRGLLTTSQDGPNAIGSEFMITFDEAHYLNGYENVFGELVEGHHVLDALEKGSDRHGNVTEDFTISAAGPK